MLGMHGTWVLHFSLSRRKTERAVHARQIVHRQLGACLSELHAKRRAALLRAVEAALGAGRVTLSALGQRLPGSAQLKLKHRLKSVDRLLGSVGVGRQLPRIYAAVAQRLLAQVGTIVLAVDWSDLTADGAFHLLRASLIVDGRGLTIYQEVHGRKRLGHPAAHRQFLDQLATLLPPGRAVIVLSDGGFHSPWFQAVAQRGWHFIGRIRGRNQVQTATQSWLPARQWFERATTTTQDLGAGQYARNNPCDARFVLTRRPARHRHALTQTGQRQRSRKSLRSARSAREPWLLACSPGLVHLSADSIVQLYTHRMRIELDFRDTKNPLLGLGLDQARSRGRQRLSMLLLIVHLAGFVQRLIGEAVRAHAQLELQFVATLRPCPEASVLTLGRRFLNDPRFASRPPPIASFSTLARQANRAFEAAL